jgi:hypothetical protein
MTLTRRPNYGKGTPHLNLGDCFTLIKKIADTGGQDGTFDVLTKVFDNKLTSSRFKLKLASLKAFGLITTEGETSYSLSPLAVSYIHPVSEMGQVHSMQAAFLRLSTLKTIWENQKGKTIPLQLDFFANYLAQAFRIPAELKMQWAKYFIDSGLAAKVIEQRAGGYYVNLVIASSIGTDSKTQDPKSERETPKSQFDHFNSVNLVNPINNANPVVEEDDDDNFATVSYSKTLSSGRVLRMFIPESPSSDDAKEIISRCQFVIKAMKGFVED